MAANSTKPNRPKRPWRTLGIALCIATIVALLAFLISVLLQLSINWTVLTVVITFVAAWGGSLGILDNLGGAMDTVERFTEPENPSTQPAIIIHQHFTTPSGEKRPLQLPPRPENFTGRATELAWVMEHLQPATLFSVTAAGGMGKSALVAEAVWQLHDKGELLQRFPDGIVFYSFYGKPRIENGLAHIIKSFDGDQRGILTGVTQQILGGKHALLLLDGTENIVDDLNDLLRQRGGCGVSVTSRDVRDGAANLLMLERLDPANALTLLRKWAGRHADDEAAANQIIELVDGLPLAVRLVGRYLRETQEPAAEYSSWLEKSPISTLSHGERHEESVAVLLDQSIRQLSTVAQAIVPLIGLLALQPFDRRLLAAGLGENAESLRRPLGELVRYGMLNHTNQTGWVVSHALIHSYARTRPNAARAEQLGNLSHYLNEYIREQRKLGLVGYAKIDEIRVHTITLIADLAEMQQWRWIDTLAWAIEDYLDIQGYAVQRGQVLRSAVYACRYLNDRHNLGAHLGNLGNAYRNLGQVERAIALMEAAVKIFDEIKSPNASMAHRSLAKMRGGK